MIMILKNTFPICFLSKSSILVFKKGCFLIFDITNEDISKVVNFRMPFIEAILTRIPFFARILRKGIRCGIKATEDIILFVVGQKIYELNIKKRLISNGYETIDKSRPLSFSRIEGIKGFNNGIYFGGYKGNPNKNSISIYRRIQTDIWEDVYQFPINSIEHIHNIVPDPFKNVVYILTGDFENSAGIWIAEDNFKSVKPLLVGDQKFRACVGFPTSNGLVYATDSPFSNNSIRLLHEIDNKWESLKLLDINGPSIYGCRWCDDFLFSTSVESDSQNYGIKYKLFGIKKGTGIVNRASYIYKGNLEYGFNEIYKVKKDCLPFYLFQFGVLIFPSELNESSYLPVYHIATSKNGMNTILLTQ